MTHPVRIPADVDREDRVIADLTARQVLLLVLTAAGLYLAWTVTHAVLPLAVFALLAVPVAVFAGILVLGQRDGLSFDRLLVAVVRHRTSPRQRINAPEGVPPPPAWLAARATGTPDTRRSAGAQTAVPLRLPARTVASQGGVGVIDLGTDGLAMVAVVSTVNFSLKTPEEQDGLVAVFARYLHSLTAPVQILVRAMPADLTDQIQQLDEAADLLPHPALAQAAREHATYLAGLAAEMQLLTRQVLLVLREPLVSAGPVDGLGGASPLAALSGRRAAARDARRAGAATRRAAHTRLARRLAEATDLLAPAGIVVTALDAGTATSVLAAACNPAGRVPPAALAAPDEVITADLPDSYPDDDTYDDGGDVRDASDAEDLASAVGSGYGDSLDGDGWDGPFDPEDPDDSAGLDAWVPPAPSPPVRRPRRSARRAGEPR
ncbi:PrgI family protein [Frankia sp. AiPa1]|uniref:PrgI family protein n=1 Tax=Frankia sp. AiPa1 TaxID=573492 RepID=UPI0020360E4A|nr:PrgI family protein [Frankia sp. AiPa1]